MKRNNWETIKNKTYNYLKVIDESYIKNWEQKVLVKCICWIEKKVKVYDFITWNTKSCWCKKIELLVKSNTTHGLYSIRWIYWVYRWIYTRCNNKKDQHYKNYWWRWIKCLWNSFEEFYKDMWSSYKKWLSIDRIDNNWNYCKENCRRVDNITQQNNKRTNNYIKYNWKTQTISQRSKELWINVSTIKHRLDRWLSVNDALILPK